MDTPDRRVWGENFLTLWIHLTEGFGVKGGPKAGRVTLQIILLFIFTLTCPKTFTRAV